jgi:LysM repeat protein
MRYLLSFIFFLPFAFTSCSMMGSSPKEEKHQLELTLHRIRTDLEEIKHDMTSYQMQLQILEGKITAGDDLIAAIKERLQETQKSAWNQLEYQISLLEKKSKSIEMQNETLITQFSSFQQYANDTTKALVQYKEKIKDLEKACALNHDFIEQIKNKKTHSLVKGEAPFKTYIVKPGDSLDKIARTHETTADELKKLNHLSHDLIIVGQELIVPIPHA